MPGRRPRPDGGGLPTVLYGSIIRGAARFALSTVLAPKELTLGAPSPAYDLGLAYGSEASRGTRPRALVPAWRTARDHHGPAGARESAAPHVPVDQ